MAIDAAISYPDPPLRGSRFVLRPFRPDDFEAAAAFVDRSHEPWVQPMVSTDPVTVAAFFEQCRVAGEMLHLVIAASDDDAYLGEVMLSIDENDVGELGCGIIEAERGCGTATQALRLLAEWSVTCLQLGRVQVIVALENDPALRLIDRAGFRREGVLRAYWEHNGNRIDAVIASLLPQDLALS